MTVRSRSTLRACLHAILLAVLASALVGARIAQAQVITPLTGSTAQMADGNLADDSGYKDWQGLNAAGQVTAVNDGTNANEAAWRSGSSELSPDGWAFDTLSLNGMSDIRSAYHAKETTSGGSFVYLATARQSDLHDLYATWEFNQRTGTWTNAQNTAIACRTTGDIILTVNLQGSAMGAIQPYRWTTSTANADGCARTGTLTSLATPTSANLQADMNPSNTTNYMIGPNTFQSRTFGEMALTYDAVFGAGCTRFLQAQVKSRENSSLTANMRDRVTAMPADLGGCGINLVKTGPATATHDAPIVYTYTLTNTGQRGLSAVSVTDPGCSAMGAFTKAGGDTDTLLEPGETWTTTCSTQPAHAVGETDPIDTTATASGASGSDVVSASDGHSVDLVHPVLSIDERIRRGTTGIYVQGPIQVAVGDSIGLQFDIANTGDTGFTANRFDSSKCDAGTMLGPSGDADNDATLDAGETWRYSCRHVVIASDADPFTMPATFSGAAPWGTRYSTTDTATADILKPAIAVTGEARRLPSGTFTSDGVALHADEQLQHRITATNPGDTPLTPVLSSTGCDAGSTSSPSGDTNSNGKLDPGESWVWTCTQSAGSAPADPLPFSASVTGTDALGVTRTASTSRSSDIVRPQISVNARARIGTSGSFVEGPLAPLNGQRIDVEILATTTGDPITPTVAATGCDSGTLSGPVITGGNGNALLETGETARWTCWHIVAVADGNGFTTGGTVTGTDAIGGTVSAADTVTVNVSRPAMTVDAKVRRGSSGTFADGPVPAYAGDTLEAQLTVANTGNIALTPAVTPTGCSGLTGSNATIPAGQTRTWTCTRTVTTTPDPNVVSFSVTGDDGVGHTVSGSDSASSDVLKPAITISLPSPVTQVRTGQAATRRVSATNTGDATFNVSLVVSTCDSGTLTAPSGDTGQAGRMSPGETWTWQCSQTASAGAGDPMTFSATVTGTDDLAGTHSATASITTDVLHPAVTMDLTATPGTGHVGDTVTLRQTITNPGDTPLGITSTGTRCDNALSAWTGDADGDAKLDTNETWQRTCTHLLTNADPDPLGASATVTGTDPLGGTVTATDSETIEILKPAIAVDLKIRRGTSGTYVDGPLTAHAGDTIQAQITVTNTGDATLTPTVTPTGCSGLSGASGSLAAGATRIYTCQRTADTDPSNLAVSASGQDALGRTVTATDTASADLINPLLSVSIVGNPAAVADGGTVNRRVDATNTGDTRLDMGSLSVSGCNAGTLSGPTGDTGSPGRMDPGETWSWTCTQTATAAAGDPLAFSASLSGTDGIGGVATASANATTDVLHPAVALNVTASVDAGHVGDGFIITHTATNPGDTALTVSLSSTRCDGGTMGAWTGDSDGDGKLDPNETWTRTCTHVITGGDADPVVASATVTGTDALGTAKTATASDSVEIYKPQITADVKIRRGASGSYVDGPLEAHDGDTIQARITLTNPGDVALTTAVAPTGCTGLSGPSDALDPGETHVHTCTRTVDSDPVSISATATGTDPIGGQVSATDAAGADALHPAITLDQQGRVGAASWQDGPLFVRTGQTVQMRYTATTSGDAALTPALSSAGCDSGTRSAAAGDTDGDGRLDPGESWVWTCTRAVDASDADPFVSTGTVTGTDALGRTVSDDDDVVHDAIVTGIAVTTTASRGGAFTGGPLDARVGDTLTLRAVVTSSSDFPVSIAQSFTGCDGGTLGLTGDDADGVLESGETWTYECTHVVSGAEPDPFTVEFDATASDGIGGTATAEDEVTVRLLAPAIATTLEAQRDEDAWSGGPLDVRDGDVLGFRWTLVNQGDAEATVSETTPPCDSGTITARSGDTDADGKLDVGETWTRGCTREVVAGDADTLTRTYAVTVSDPLGTTASASDGVALRTHRPDLAVAVSARPDGNGSYEDDPLSAHVNEVVDYRAVLSNPGNTDLTISVPTAVCGPGAPAGDDGDGLLQPGETWTYECEKTIVDADRDPMPGAFAFVGADLLGSTAAASDGVEVDILGPVIQVDGLLRRQGDPAFVQGPIDVHTGDVIEYEFTVSNTGDTDLGDITFFDDECDAGTLQGPTGDTGAPGQMAVGEQWVYTCEHEVLAGDADPFDSIVEVEGTDPIGGAVDDGTDLMRADRLDPAIDVVLEQRRGTSGPYTTATVDAHAGAQIQYRWSYTTAGDAPLAVSATGLSCDGGTLTARTGDTDGDNRLDPGETWQRTCRRAVLAGDDDPRTASITATGTDALGGQVTDTATADTDRLDPALSLTAEARRAGDATWRTSGVEVHTGDTIEYRFIAANDGDTALNVALVAARCDSAPAAQPIAAGATATFTCTDVVAANDADPVVAAGTVTGTDALGGTATDSDSVSIDVLRPGVALDVTAAAGEAHANDEVAMTLEATNTGDAPLTVTPTAASCVGTLDAKPVAPGAKATWTCDRTIDADPVTQNVSVSGEDALGGIVTASDSASVDRLDPAIDLVLEARRNGTGAWSAGPIEVARDDTIELRWTATNTGDAPLGVEIAAPLCDAAPSGTTNVPAGDDLVATCTHTVSDEDDDPLLLTASATGTDALGATVTAGESMTADILEPAISLAAAARRAGDPTWRTSGVEAHDGDTIEYRFSATNDGDTPVTAGIDAPRCDATPAPQVVAAGATAHFVCDDVTASGDPDPLTSTATVTAADALGREATDEASVEVDLLHPDVAVSLDAAADRAHAGDDVELTITATNTGDAPVTAAADVPGCAALPSRSLAPGAETTWTCDRPITAATADPLDQTAEVEVTDALGGTASASDEVEIDRLDPALSVVLEGRRAGTASWTTDTVEARIGQQVELRWTATNTGDTDLEAGVALADCAPADAGTLAPGETATGACTRTVRLADGDPITLTATATGTDVLDGTATASDAVTVDVQNGGIELDLHGRRSGDPGWEDGVVKARAEFDTLVVRFSAGNTGDAALTPVFAAPICDAGTQSAPAGDADADGKLDPGEAGIDTCRQAVLRSDRDPTRVTGTVTATDPTGASFEAADEIELDRIGAVLRVDKQVRRVATGTSFSQGPIEARVGDQVEYRYAIVATGDVALTVSVADAGCDAGTLHLVAGDTDHDTLLDPDETHVHTCRHLVEAEDGDPLETTVTVTGQDFLGGQDDATDTARVEVIEPGISVDAQARRGTSGAYGQGPVEALRGDEIGQRFVVHNTGDVPLTVSLARPGCDAGTVTAATGDADGDGRLDTSETWTVTCKHRFTAQDPDPLALSVTATGTDSTGGTVDDSDTVSVQVPHPAVTLAKTLRSGDEDFAPTAQARAGDLVDFRYTIDNTGNTALNAVEVADPACDDGTIAEPAGDTDGDGRLDTNEVWTIDCTRILDPEDPDPYETTGKVTASDAFGGAVSAQDSAVLDVIGPVMAVAIHERRRPNDPWVTGPLDARMGDTLLYRFTLRNTGDSPMEVELEDRGRCDDGTLTGPDGDEDGDERLAPHEIWTYECSHGLTAESDSHVHSRLRATGTDVLGDRDSAEATVVAAVLKPGIAVRKLVRRDQGAWVEGPVEAREDEILEYRHEVDNTGDAALAVGLTDPGCEPGTLLAPTGDGDHDNRLDPSETWVYTCSDTLTAPERGEHTTAAEAAGTDRLGGTVRATADVTAQVATAEADLAATLKASSAAVTAGEDVALTATVVNAGPSAARDATLVLRLPAGLVALRAADPSQGTCAQAGAEVRCGLGRLAAGASAQATVVVTTQDAAAGEDLTFGATAASATADPGATDNAATHTVRVGHKPVAPKPRPEDPKPQPPVVVVPRHADLVVDVTPGAGSRKVGGVLTYVITVANDGPATATSVALTTTLAKAGKVLSVKTTQGRCATGRTIECALGDLPFRKRVTLTVRVRPRLPGKLKLTATAAARQSDPELRSNRDAASALLAPKQAPTRRRAARPAGR